MLIRKPVAACAGHIFSDLSNCGQHPLAANKSKAQLARQSEREPSHVQVICLGYKNHARAKGY